jgi:hypothetical protein
VRAIEAEMGRYIDGKQETVLSVTDEFTGFGVRH